MNRTDITVNIFNRVPRAAHEDFQTELQAAIDAELAPLTDEKRADLYARIVTGVEQQVGTLFSIIEYEVQRTQMWSL